MHAREAARQFVAEEFGTTAHSRRGTEERRPADRNRNEINVGTIHVAGDLKVYLTHPEDIDSLVHQLSSAPNK